MKNRVLKVSFAIAVGCSMVSCATTKSVTAAKTGCPESTIEISNHEHSIGSASWTATCRGKKYSCAQAITGQHMESSCTPDASN